MILHLPSPAHDITAGIIEDTVETAARQLQLLQNVYPLARHLGVAHQKQCRRKGSQTRTHQVSRFVLYVLRFLRPCECLVISIAVIHNFACFNNSVNKLVPFIRCTLPENRSAESARPDRRYRRLQSDTALSFAKLKPFPAGGSVIRNIPKKRGDRHRSNRVRPRHGLLFPSYDKPGRFRRPGFYIIYN